MNCPLCTKESAPLFRSVPDFEYGTYHPVDYAHCLNCGLIFQDPIPDAKIIPTFYPSEYRNYLPADGGFFGWAKALQFRRLASRLLKQFDANAKILEIGCGNGQLLLALRQKGCARLYGSDFVDTAFSELTNAGIHTKACNIETEFPFNESFDAIIMNNVVEHFSNPFKVAARCREHLNTDGKLLLITPNGDALESSFFGKHWAGFHAPRHTYIFNKENILLAGEKAGFSKAEVLSMTDPGQWAISVQNVLQDHPITKARLKNGMAWYLSGLGAAFTPIACLQNLTGKSTSMLCVLSVR